MHGLCFFLKDGCAGGWLGYTRSGTLHFGAEVCRVKDATPGWHTLIAAKSWGLGAWELGARLDWEWERCPSQARNYGIVTPAR